MMGSFYKRQGKIQTAIKIVEFAAQAFAFVVLAVFCVHIYGNRYVVKGRSMEPDIPDQAVILVDEAIYQVREPKRFDVIVYEGEFGGFSVKRVLGLPGETIHITEDCVRIDGEPLDCSAYLPEIKVAGTAAEAHTIKEGDYFLIGDWPEGSEDSRSSQIGDIHREQIRGRAWFCISPKEKLGFVKN